MLGIRSYKNFAVDLWVGAKKDFFCDLLFLFEEKDSQKDHSNLDALSSFSLSPKESRENLREKIVVFYNKLKEEKHNLRHLAFYIEKVSLSVFKDEESFVLWFKSLLDDVIFTDTKRVSILTSEVPQHNLIQNEVFQIF